ncbi:PIR Superfamily Protein [Plasmodium ovale curtisi]|uniref:PIR Superfamily Protein n=1 Tax=Plasmodium ovale curtisi TaxID=864141 RepID=A0A1A8XG16_PLAOA|nr:PIR Superfamily Protein [Plasmodium ovale curtisi]SBT02869.1 PIR Superfamily Protein [Plasmodium ovale curtisi]
MGTEEDPDITGLHANVIYSKLDRASNDYINDSNVFWSSVIAKHVMNELSIFPTLAKGFYHTSNMKDNDISYNERWNYLYLWSGLKFLESSNDFSFSNFMDLIKMVRSVNDKKGVTYDDDMLKISANKFKDLKNIYDYLQNYVTIHLKIGSFKDIPCTARYKDYVTKTHDLYKNEKERCQSNYTNNYCKVINRFVREYDKNNIKKLTCTGTKPMEVRRAVRDSRDLHVSPDFTFQLSSRDQGAQALYLQSTRDQTDGMSPSTWDTSSSSGSTNTMSIVLPLLGTVSILFVWFKFSPLGPWLYNSIFSKQITRMSAEEEGAHEILENPYSFGHRNTQEIEHNIAYHSM